MTAQQFWAGIVIVIVGYILGFYFQRRDSDSLRREMEARFDAINKRFDDLKREMDARFEAVNKRFDDLKDWIRSEVRRLEERIERPVTKP